MERDNLDPLRMSGIDPPGTGSLRDRAMGIIAFATVLALLYVGRDEFCAFIETFAKKAGTRVITTTELTLRALSQLKPVSSLRLIDLAQPGALLRMGADSRLFSGDYKISQLWSKALHDHPVKAHGLLYPSRLDPSRHAIVLFKDRGAKLTELRREAWYASGAQRALLADVLEHYDLELVENRFVAPRKPAERARQSALGLEST